MEINLWEENRNRYQPTRREQGFGRGRGSELATTCMVFCRDYTESFQIFFTKQSR